MIGCVKMREIPADDSGAMRGSNLKLAIEKDKSKGLVPFFVSLPIGKMNNVFKYLNKGRNCSSPVDNVKL